MERHWSGAESVWVMRGTGPTKGDESMETRKDGQKKSPGKRG